ncbi:MAG: radical SAM protein [Candidatus Adiutrix sp.]|nr:radical SAM protein [Candidatus Adiutrix sp.]
MPNAPPRFSEVFRDPTGQVALLQAEDRYLARLAARFGGRFLDYRRRWAEASARGDPGEFPLSLDLAVNSGCQLSCLMCPLPGRPGGRRVRLMDSALYESLMLQAEEHALPALTLGLGSEPLLHPEAPRLVARAARAGVMDIRLGTNGLALSAEAARALVDSGLTRLEISVDAARPETYRQVRGGSLGELERAIETFLDQRRRAASETPLLRLSFLRLDENRAEEAEFLERFGPLADMLALQDPLWFPGTRLPPPGPGRRLIAENCAQPWQRLGLDQDGRPWPCCAWPDAAFPPLDAASDLARVWRSPEMAAWRHGLAGPPAGWPAPCRFCWGLRPQTPQPAGGEAALG